jgi:DNA-directed RNA polymerase subunit delta
MQRLIRSFNTLTDELKEMLQQQFPDGIDSTHIKTVPTAKGEILRVIELRTSDAMYLIKINSESRAEIEEFLDQEDAPAVADDDTSTDIETDDAEEEEEETDDADEDGDADGEEDEEDED